MSPRMRREDDYWGGGRFPDRTGPGGPGAGGGGAGTGGTPPPDPNADLIKWGTYGQGQRPRAWTQFGKDLPQGVTYDPTLHGNWYRDPSHPAHLVWNPYQGFQNYRDVLEQIKANPAAGVRDWQMEKHPDWWQSYDISKWGLDPALVGRNKFGTGGAGGGGGGGGLPTDLPGGLGLPYASDLEKFGYSGPIGFNPWEQAAMDFTKEIYQNRNAGTLDPAKEFYNKLLGGGFGPESQAYAQGVYDPLKAEHEALMQEQSKRMASQFANRGGFFGGKHAVAQGKMAAEGTRGLETLLGGLKQDAYKSNIANMLGGAAGLEGLAGTERGIQSSLLGDIMGVGGMASQREMTNKALWQDAMLRQYDDWLRARNENFLPMNWLLASAGMQTQMPMAQQPQPSPWSYLFGGLGSAIGALPFAI